MLLSALKSGPSPVPSHASVVTGTKKQHFVPQSLLRRFATKTEQIQVYDKALDKQYPSSVRNAGHQNHFLTIPSLDGDGGAGAFFEPYFQQFEDPAKGAIDRVLAACALGIRQVVDDEARADLALFLAVQYARTPAARDRLLDYMDAMKVTMQELGREIARRNGFPRSIRKRIEFEWTNSNDRETHAALGLTPQMFLELGERLMDSLWVVYLNQTPDEFYLSDNPVAYQCHAPRPGRGVGPGSYGVELTMPMDPRHILVLVERGWARDHGLVDRFGDGYLAGSVEPGNIEYYRSLQVRSASRYLYSLSGDFELARRMCAEAPKLRTSDGPKTEVIFGGRRLR